MKKPLTIAFVCITLLGCAAPTLKPKSEVSFGPKPTEEQAMEKIRMYLASNLIDPMSAMIRCNKPSDEGWVWRGPGFDIKYGYLVQCDVNAKNRFGGYVGATRYVFRFNGNEFEHEVFTSVGKIGQYK